MAPKPPVGADYAHAEWHRECGENFEAARQRGCESTRAGASFWFSRREEKNNLNEAWSGIYLKKRLQQHISTKNM
jgi:hypothetical protein